MTIANNKVMTAFTPVIVRGNMLCLEGGDDGKMIWDLMLAVNAAATSPNSLCHAPFSFFLPQLRRADFKY